MSIFMVLMIGGCKDQTSSTESTDSKSTSDSKNAPVVTEPSTDTVKHNVKPVVTIEMEDGAKIKIELYPEIAPNTVNNFVSLVQKGFYNGLIFHRVIPAFMIQGGDPQGTGMGGPGYSIKGEFADNKVVNTLKHTKGVISMARSTPLDSAGSQFFIMAADVPSLDGKYAAFGKVIEGLAEVDKIVGVAKDANDKPNTPQKMKTVTVDTLGEKFAEPTKVK
ncbi:MAG: peptidylprolyl isomerase [Clostridiaceae bacterium]|nr:peptidylprolyl isomerase [Clostridiaceae bacterium]